MVAKLKYLTSEQKKFYEDNGYIKLSGDLTNDELYEIYNEYNKIFARKQKENVDGLGRRRHE